jgi:hypothetical protein
MSLSNKHWMLSLIAPFIPHLKNHTFPNGMHLIHKLLTQADRRLPSMFNMMNQARMSLSQEQQLMKLTQSLINSPGMVLLASKITWISRSIREAMKLSTYPQVNTLQAFLPVPIKTAKRDHHKKRQLSKQHTKLHWLLPREVPLHLKSNKRLRAPFTARDRETLRDMSTMLIVQNAKLYSTDLSKRPPTRAFNKDKN